MAIFVFRTRCPHSQARLPAQAAAVTRALFSPARVALATPRGAQWSSRILTLRRNGILWRVVPVLAYWEEQVRLTRLAGEVQARLVPQNT